MLMWEGKLTLAQCNNIITKLRSMLWMSSGSGSNPGRRNGVPGTVPDMSVKMNLGDLHLCNNYVDGLKSKLGQLQQQVNRQEELYQSIYKLRAHIVQTNCEVGINECLGEITRLNDLIGLYQTIKDQCAYEDTVDHDYLDSVRTPASTPVSADGATSPLDGLVSSTRKVRLFSQLELDDKIQNLRTQVSACELKRDRLNSEHTVTVELAEDIAKLLSLTT